VRLGINLDHVATLRQARGGARPDPLYAAFVAIDAGADGITLHLREDRRHIQDADVQRVRESVDGQLNLEMAATEEMIDFAERIGPDDCCLVPERRAELTTEGGLDVVGAEQTIGPTCRRLRAAGIEVSLFVDPDSRQVAAAQRCGAAAVEIHTGPYANARDASARARELEAVSKAADHAVQCGLAAHAGHGLDYFNVDPVAAIEAVSELNIGHAVVARAVIDGLATAVQKMRGEIDASRRR